MNGVGCRLLTAIPLGMLCGGVGADAQVIEDRFRDYNSDTGSVSSTDRADALSNDLYELWAECGREKNWDGYGALQINKQAFLKTVCLLRTLPRNFSLPELSGTPDGDIALDWDNGPRRSVSAIISERPRVVFAAICGDEEWSGSSSAVGSFPRSIIEAVRRIGQG